MFCNKLCLLFIYWETKLIIIFTHFKLLFQSEITVYILIPEAPLRVEVNSGFQPDIAMTELCKLLLFMLLGFVTKFAKHSKLLPIGKTN